MVVKTSSSCGTGLSGVTSECLSYIIDICCYCGSSPITTLMATDPRRSGSVMLKGRKLHSTHNWFVDRQAGDYRLCRNAQGGESSAVSARKIPTGICWTVTR